MEKSPEPIGPPFKALGQHRAKVEQRRVQDLVTSRERAEERAKRQNARHVEKPRMPWHG